MIDVQDVPITDLSPAPWTATYTLRPDLRQIETSIKGYGILSPIVVKRSGNVIIDGLARVNIAHKLGWKEVPVTFLDIDEIDAMLLHVRLNRYRGDTVARRLSIIIRRLLNSERYDMEDLRISLGMTRDEFDVLADGTILKHRKIDQHAYSAAWVPIESSSGEDVRIERPSGKPEQVD